MEGPSYNVIPKEKKVRIRKACDSCNAKRTKCDGNDPCSHCLHIKIECTYLREEKRRGRASAKYPKQIRKRKTENLSQSIGLLSEGSPKIGKKSNVQLLPKKAPVSLINSSYVARIPSNTLLYKKPHDFELGETRFPVLLIASEQLKDIGIPFSIADELLGYYFTSTIQPASRVFSIIRKIPMLESRRKSKPALLLVILLASAAQIDHAFFVGSNRDYACQSLYRKIQSLLPESVASAELDDLITIIHLGFLMPWLSYTSDSVHWWRLGYEISSYLKINKIDSSLSGDMAEERLRTWWGLYILDRLTALCFNVPILISDSECLDVFLPYDEFIWSTTIQEVILPIKDPHRTKFLDGTQVGFDLYGWSLPICSIMGKFVQYKKAEDIELKHVLKAKLVQAEFANSESLDKFQNMIQTISSPAKEAQATLDILYARYINHVLSFITSNIQDSDTLGEFAHEVTDEQLAKLSKCIEILENILKYDENLHSYPFFLSFFLFVNAVSFISVLNNFNSADHSNVNKINRIKYFVKVLVRAIEGVLVAFPCDFLKMLRNQLVLSIKDCENLIILTDYIDKFRENSRKRKNILEAYSWGDQGRGIAV